LTHLLEWTVRSILLASRSLPTALPGWDHRMRVNRRHVVGEGEPRR